MCLEWLSCTELLARHAPGGIQPSCSPPHASRNNCPDLIYLRSSKGFGVAFFQDGNKYLSRNSARKVFVIVALHVNFSGTRRRAPQVRENGPPPRYRVKHVREREYLCTGKSSFTHRVADLDCHFPNFPISPRGNTNRHRGISKRVLSTRNCGNPCGKMAQPRS